MESQNSNENGLKQPQVGVVMVPYLAQGHLNQLLHLSHLITAYGLPVHYTGSATHNRQVKLRVHGWDSKSLNKIHFHDFPLPPHISHPPKPDPSTHFPTHLEPLFDASKHLRGPVSQLLQQLSLKYRRITVIFDSLMTYVVQDVKLIPNAESYVFFPVSTFTMFMNMWELIPKKPFELDFDDIPNCIPSNEGCLSPKVFEFLLDQQKLLGFENGMLYNTSRLIEGTYIRLLEMLSTNAETKTKHFAVGPLNPVKIESKNGDEGHLCLQWLDKQEKGSVIYICFGSTTSMKDEQITELALGLERSEQKFIWVLRNADSTNVFTGADASNAMLPEGYEDRVKNNGLVVRDWAPQLQILAHPSTGAFVSHCGWNSCMESISMGVPIAAWPMHSDQPRNAVLVTDVLKIGVLVRDWTHRDEVVTSTTIENLVRKLMVLEEGKGIQKRARELGEAVRVSVTTGGASNLEMNSFITHITR